MKCSHECNMLNHIVSFRYLSPLKTFKLLCDTRNRTEIYRSNVIKRSIWYKTCDDTVAATVWLYFYGAIYTKDPG